MPATASHLAAPSTGRTALAVGLSLLLHLLAALVLALGPRWTGQGEGPPPDPPAVVVELVPAPQDPRPPRPPPAVPEGRVAPNLTPGDLGRRTDPGADGKDRRDDRPGAIASSEPRAKPTVTERDLVLSQVIRRWRRPPQLALLEDGSVALAVTVLADGTLGPPYGRAQPWNPGAAIEGWDRMPPGGPHRAVVESIYRALREAQPLSLPPRLSAKAPFELRLDFRFRDVR